MSHPYLMKSYLSKDFDSYCYLSFALSIIQVTFCSLYQEKVYHAVRHWCEQTLFSFFLTFSHAED